MERETLLTLTADITAAHVSNNTVNLTDVPTLIASVFGALSAAIEPPAAEPTFEPAVSVRSSVKPDHIVCLDCGVRGKMLKRHIMTAHGLTPDEYRARYGLPADYPMTAPGYSERRRVLAKEIGLGRDPHQRRGRRKKAA